MTSLRTNIAAMTALTTLSRVARDLDLAGARVSTGRRVSAAADNVAYWSIATGMRTDNAALAAVRDTLGIGASALDTAYGGLTSVLSDLQTLRAKLQTALQPGVDRAKIQPEIAAIQDKMRATARSSVSAGGNWLSVDSAAGERATQSIVAGFTRSAAGAVTAARIEIDVADLALYDAAPHGVTAPATSAKVTAEQALPGTTDFSAGASVRFALGVDGAPARTLTLDATTLASAVPDLSAVAPDEIVRAIDNAINSDAALAGTVRAGLDADGRLTFETTATGGARRLVVGRDSTGTDVNLVANGGFEGSLGGWTWSGSNIAAAANPHSGSASLRMGTVGGSGEIRTPVPTMAGQSYTLTFWLANDSGLPNHFAAYWNGAPVYVVDNAASSQPYAQHSVTVAAGGPSLLTFEARHDPGYWFVDDVSVSAVGGGPGPTLGFGSGPSGSATGRGSDAATGTGRGLLDTVDGGTGVSIAKIDVAALAGTTGDAALRTLVTQVETAIAQVISAGTKLGASRTQIDGQKTFVDALMKANDRTIGILVDADVEEESTKLKALRTQQQLAVQTLSIANAAGGTLLALFR